LFIPWLQLTADMLVDFLLSVVHYYYVVWCILAYVLWNELMRNITAVIEWLFMQLCFSVNTLWCIIFLLPLPNGWIKRMAVLCCVQGSPCEGYCSYNLFISHLKHLLRAVFRALLVMTGISGVMPMIPRLKMLRSLVKRIWMT